MKQEIILRKGPDESHPIELEIQENERCVGGAYYETFLDLLETLIKNENLKENPWHK